MDHLLNPFHLILSSSLDSIQSKWYGYLQSLPTRTVEIAALWGHEYDDDSDIDTGPREEETEIDEDLRAARAWMAHTNIAHELEVSSEEEVDGDYQEGTAGQSILVSPGHTSYGKFSHLLYSPPFFFLWLPC
jgi:hypothetical protein